MNENPERENKKWVFLSTSKKQKREETQKRKWFYIMKTMMVLVHSWTKKQLVFIYLFFSFFWFGFLDWSWFLKLEGRGGVDLQVRMDENERVALQQFRAKGEERMRVFSGHFGTSISNLFFSFLLSVLYFLNALVLTDFSKERKSSVSLCLLSLLCSAKNVTHDTTPPFLSFTLYAIDRL